MLNQLDDLFESKKANLIKEDAHLCYQDERRAIKETLKSDLYLKCRKVLKFTLKLSAIDYLYDLHVELGRRKYCIGGLLFRLLSVLLAVDCSILLTLQFLHDARLKKFLEAAKSDSNPELSYEDCLLNNSILDYQARPGEKEAKDILDALYKWIELLGNPFLLHTGAAVIYMNTLGLFPLFYYIIVPDLMRHRDCRLRHIDFLLKPLTELRMLQVDLARVVTQLEWSLKTIYTVRQDLELNVSEQRQYRAQAKPVLASFRSSSRFASTHKFPAEHQQNNSDLIALVREILAKYMVVPRNLETRWHYCLTWMSYYALSISHCANLILGFFILNLCILSEAYARSHMRYRLIDCQQRFNTSSAIVARDALRLKSIGNHDRSAYLDSDGSFLSLLFLALTVEMKTSVGSSVYVSAKCFLYTAMSMLLFTWISIHLILFAISIVDRWIWLKQIGEQLDSCLRHSEMLISLLGQGERQVYQATACQFQHSLYRIVLISYLNLSLYKKRSKQFQESSSLTITSMGILCAETLIGCYLVATYTNLIMKSVVTFAVIYAFVAANFYLVIGATLYDKSRSLSTKVLKLLAGCVTSISRLRATQAAANRQVASDLETISDLLRRHVMSEVELSDMFAFSSFGVILSFDKIVAFNAYSMTLAILYMRSA